MTPISFKSSNFDFLFSSDEAIQDSADACSDVGSDEQDSQLSFDDVFVAMSVPR